MFTIKNEVEAGSAYRQGLSTEEFAKRYFVKPQSVRKQYSQKGAYFGVVPTKLKNGRLEWPDNSRDAFSVGKPLRSHHE